VTTLVQAHDGAPNRTTGPSTRDGVRLAFFWDDLGWGAVGCYGGADPAQGHEGLAPLRAELLPTLSSRGSPRGSGGYLHDAHWVSLRGAWSLMGEAFGWGFRGRKLGLGLCIMLEVNFRESPECELRLNGILRRSTRRRDTHTAGFMS
jgi:hypothetical protein